MFYVCKYVYKYVCDAILSFLLNLRACIFHSTVNSFHVKSRLCNNIIVQWIALKPVYFFVCFFSSFPPMFFPSFKLLFSPSFQPIFPGFSASILSIFFFCLCSIYFSAVGSIQLFSYRSLYLFNLYSLHF